MHYPKLCRSLRRTFIIAAVILVIGVGTLHAKIPDTLSISVDEAIEIGMVNSYLLRQGLLDLSTADSQVREA